jgi:methyl-accepting chemotaxis protein
MTEHTDFREVKVPAKLIWLIGGICLLPFLLGLLGMDFGTQGKPFPFSEAEGMAAHERVDAMHRTLSGSFWHTIHEWSAVCTAVFIVVLAFIHFRLTGAMITPIIAVALFCAGAMDAFHTFAADRLIEVVADNRNLVPFTWAISRLFNALILIGGMGLFLLKDWKEEADGKQKGNLGFILLVSLVFGVIAYAIIHACATSDRLPETMFPEALITRPWDVAPLLLYLFAGAVVFPRFFRKYPSLFSHALVVSTIPQVMTQLHMAFGSTALFDSHFNIAHFIKIVAYAVPFTGLALDYVRTYRVQKELGESLEQRVAERTRDLEKENIERRRTEESLREQSGEVAEGANVLASSIREILASTTQLASSVTETATAVTQTATTAEEVKQTANLSGEKARTVSEEAGQVTLTARQGREAAEEAAGGMEKIREQMGSIAESVVRLSEQNQAIEVIITTVDGLAEQSNLLAVNASIEAARAGEEGKAFAVVAEEIKNMAEQSKQATGQVRSILSDVQRGTSAAVMAAEQGSKVVESGVAQAGQAGASIRSLVVSMESASQSAAQIAASIQEQMAGMDQMASAMEDVRRGSGQNAASIQQVEQSARELDALGQRLKELAERNRG